MPLLALVLLLSATTARASDLAGERAWAQALAGAPEAPQLQWLEADGVAFPALWHRADRRPAMGAAILLHDRGAHPAWPQVIAPLRRALARRGWATLSLAVPDVPPWAPSLRRGRARIDAGLAFLAARGVANVALVGHGLGALLAADFLARRDDPAPVRAAVLVSLPGREPGGPDVDGAALLARLSVPVLDIFGEADRLSVRLAAQARRVRAREADPMPREAPPSPSPKTRRLRLDHSGNPGYRQVRVPGADHLFLHRQAWLAKAVGDWLLRAAPGMEIAR